MISIRGVERQFRNLESSLAGEKWPSNDLGAGEDEPLRRRVKKNKYAKFSKSDEKKALETVEEAIVNVRKREAENKMDVSAAVRGTTVPTVKASPKINRKVAKFNNHRKIVPSDPYTFGYIEIGTVGPPHGIKGEVKIVMDNTDFAEDRLSVGSLIYIRKPSRRSPRPIRVTMARKQVGTTWLVSFENIFNRAGAMAFRNFKVYVRVEDRPVIREDEYLIRDLVGLQCLVKRDEIGYDNDDAKNIRDGVGADGEMNIESCPPNTTCVARVNGVISPDDLCDPGVRHLMHAMLEIQLHTSKMMCMIPLVPEIVVEVNTRAGFVMIEPPEGLLNYTYEEEESKRVVIRGFLPDLAPSVNAQLRKELEMVTVVVPFLPSLANSDSSDHPR